VNTIMACGGVEGYLHAFLTLALDTRKWSGSFYGHFSPQKKRPCCSLNRRLIGPYILLIWLCTMKHSDMFKLKNILEKSVYYVICSFVALVNVCVELYFYALYVFTTWCCIK
jgi:hypothetical protein